MLRQRKKIREVSGEPGANFSNMTDSEVKDYFAWAFRSLENFSLLKEDYEELYKLFHFSATTHKLFMEHWCKLSYGDGKSEKDNADFFEYLRFLFEIGRNDDQEMVGKYLCRLSKQKLATLDEKMMTIYFKEDLKAAQAWKNIKETAVNTNPLLNNLSHLFKKK